jgi:hypothetical protein
MVISFPVYYAIVISYVAPKVSFRSFEYITFIYILSGLSCGTTSLHFPASLHKSLHTHMNGCSYTVYKMKTY